MTTTSPPTADRAGRPRRPLRVGPPELHDFAAADGAGLRLTRHRGGGKGPVMLVHCIGVSSGMYTVDTIETNLTEFLVGHGYDVWLLDFRLSIALPASHAPSSFDDVATLDFPAAVAKVREVTGTGSVQVVAHGVGSQTFTMAMLAGLQGVRAAVCSQVSAHLQAPWFNAFKASFRVPSLLAALGVKTMTVTPGPHPTWRDRLFDFSLRFHPIQREERCQSAVCRRITALYGPLYEHDQLSPATHDSLGELFGPFNLRAFRHLMRNLMTGHIVREDGEEAYLPHLDRLAIPIAFLHGADNDCLLPESTRRTWTLLRERNGDGLYRWHAIPGYGHVDCMFGKDAVRDVYPLILEHLEATPA